MLEENNFFGDWISGINHILSNTNAQIIPIKNGEEIGPVKGFSAYDINGKMVFEPKIIEKKQYLDMLRNKEGFIEYLNTLDINLPQITIQRGMVKTNRGDIKPISEIADLLYN